MSVHRGFDHALDSVWPQVEEAIEKADGKRVLFHGHSLGGALAQLAAVRAVEAGVVEGGNISLYTIGSPRIGNAAFADFVTQQIPTAYRLVNESEAGLRDLVSTVPPRRLGFRHGGQELVLLPDGHRQPQRKLPTAMFRFLGGEATGAGGDPDIEALSDEAYRALMQQAFGESAQNGPTALGSIPIIENLRTRLELHRSAGYLDRTGHLLRGTVSP